MKDSLLLLFAVIGLAGCALRPKTPSVTYEDLAARCDLTMPQLDSLIAASATQARSSRGVQVSEPAFATMLATTLPEGQSPDCRKHADFLSRTVTQ
jgi:hypothetical protein